MDAAIVATQKKFSNIRQTLPWENASKKFSKAACCRLLSTIDTHIGFIAFQFRG
jgi:hypothetical protein